MPLKLLRHPADIPRRALISGLAAGLVAGLPHPSAQAATVVHGTVIGKDGWLFLIWDDPREANLKAVAQVSDLVKTAVATLKAAGIATVIPYIPSKSRLYREDLPDDIKWSPDAERRYALAAANLRSSGALVPDLLQTFQQLRKDHPDEKLWFKCDTHWTAWAAEHSAVEVAQQMKGWINLPRNAKPGMRLGPPVTRVHARSDLSVVLPPALRANYPDETYNVQWPAALSAESALSEEEVGDVAIVGSSYMQPAFNFAPMLSSQLDRPISLFWKVHNFGPYATMLSYLTSDSFKKQRPKAIVWSFLETDLEVMPDNKLSWGESAMTQDAFLTGIKRGVGG